MTTDQPQRIGPIARALAAALNAPPAADPYGEEFTALVDRAARGAASTAEGAALRRRVEELRTAHRGAVQAARDNHREAMAERERAAELERERDAIRALDGESRAIVAEAALARVRAVVDDMQHTTGARTWAVTLAAALDGEQAAPEPDECRIVEVDGTAVRVRGTGETTDTGRQFLAEVVAAAKRRHTAEQAAPEDVR